MFKPTRDILVVKPEVKEQIGSIYIPETARERPMTAIVVAVGNGTMGLEGTFVRGDVKVGDRIAYSENIGQDLEWEGEHYIMVKERDVMGIFDE